MLSKLNSKNPSHDRTVVRVTTSSWMDDRGLHTKRSLNILKRYSFGHNLLKEECSISGAEDAVRNITNLHDIPDGVYHVVPDNFSRDWETGYIDDWELRLVPFTMTCGINQ